MGKGIIYKVKKGETLESLAEDFGISVDELRRFHNNWCEDIRDQIGYDIWEGKKLTVEKEKLSKEEVQQNKEEKYQEEKQQKQEQKEKEEEAKRTEQDNKYYVVDGAKCLCDKGTIPATLKVTSHTKTIFNSKDKDKWTATSEDLQFKEGASCFGSCKVKNNNPCSFAPAGKWLKPYEKLNIMEKTAILETSYLMCSVGGKITIQHHGQSVKIGNSNLQRADAELMNQILPGLDLQNIQAEYDAPLSDEINSDTEEPKIVAYTFTDLTGKKLEEISYNQKMFLQVHTVNMRDRKVNYSIYDDKNGIKTEVRKGQPKKIIKPNGVVNFEENFFIDMPMRTGQSTSADEHHFKIRIWEIENETNFYED
jgi:hypothetical protein